MFWERNFDEDDDDNKKRKSFFNIRTNFSSTERRCEKDKDDENFIICKNITRKKNPETGKMEKSEKIERIKKDNFDNRGNFFDFKDFEKMDRFEKDIEDFIKPVLDNFGIRVENENIQNVDKKKNLVEKKIEDIPKKNNLFQNEKEFKDGKIYDF